MKYAILIRFLAGLTFLIFLCPFFQMCSDESRFKKSVKYYSRERTKDETTENAYQLSLFDTLGQERFYFDWVLVPFTLIILGAVVILVFSLRNHFFALRFICYLNLGLTLLFLSLMFFGLLLEDFTQIKYGYYLFVLNTIVIIILSKKITSTISTTL